MESPKSVLLIGREDISGIVEGLTHTQRLNSKSTLSFSIPIEAAQGHSIDFSAQVTWSTIDPRFESLADRGDLRFAGRVGSARAHNGAFHIICHSLAARFEDVQVLALKNELTGPDSFVLLASLGGVPSDRVNPGQAGPIEEDFEVILPLRGLRVTEPLAVGDVRLRGPEELTEFKTLFDPNPGYQAVASNSHAIARVQVTAKWAIDAELKGRRMVEDVLAWAMVRISDARIGSVSACDYSSGDTKSQPALLGVAVVNSLGDRGRYMRSLSTAPRATIANSEDGRLSLPGFNPTILSTHLSDALASFARAYISTGTPAVLAIWECIEFVVANTDISPLFKKSQTRALRRASRSLNLSSTQQQRFDDAVASLNAPPLLAKLRDFATTHGVVVTDFEMSLIAELRKHRNDVMHGRRPDSVEPEDMRHGLSIVARILTAAIQDAADAAAAPH